MKKNLLFATLAALLVSTAFAKEKSGADTNLTPQQVEAQYTAAIESRTAGILKVLNLTDAAKTARVHDLIIAQYRALNAWHGENDAKLKAARADQAATASLRASLKTLHDGFLAQLAENLTPEQIEQVKDKLTYGKVQFTFAGYCAAYSDLSEAHKQEVLRLLKEAREEAMDAGSADEKSAIFNRYKGKINNYLAKQGVHPDKQKSN